jgi:glycosyltransferase involved in cell wall biosynthesis
MSMHVSTIIPVYNAERTIAQAIDSALSQDYKGHEVIVVNDGSTDSTAAILNGYGDRIRIVSVPNGGPARARNVGVAESTGKYLAFLDADDMWLPHKLKTMIAVLEKNPSATLAFSEFSHIDKDGVVCAESSLGHAPSMDGLLTPRPLPILPSTWVLRRQTFDKIGGFNEEFRGAGWAHEDTWMLMLLRELGEFVYVSDKLILYRIGSSAKSADKYGPGLRVFVSLLKRRYGPRSRSWIRNTTSIHCRDLLSKTAHQMKGGNRFGAVRTLASIFWLRPSYFLEAEFRERLLLPQNIKRLRGLTAIFGRAHD